MVTTFSLSCDRDPEKAVNVDPSCSIQFCDDSASIPRGVVYPPVNLTGHTQNCPNGSTVVDTQGPPPVNCTNDEPVLYASLYQKLIWFCAINYV